MKTVGKEEDGRLGSGWERGGERERERVTVTNPTTVSFSPSLDLSFSLSISLCVLCLNGVLKCMGAVRSMWDGRWEARCWGCSGFWGCWWFLHVCFSSSAEYLSQSWTDYCVVSWGYFLSAELKMGGTVLSLSCLCNGSFNLKWEEGETPSASSRPTLPLALLRNMNNNPGPNCLLFSWLACRKSQSLEKIANDKCLLLQAWKFFYLLVSSQGVELRTICV